MEIQQFYVTFGVQYTLDPNMGERHPLGMHANTFAVIEAPDMDTAQRIASAIFHDKYAFVYGEDAFMGAGTYERWYEGVTPALTIKWVQP